MRPEDPPVLGFDPLPTPSGFRFSLAAPRPVRLEASAVLAAIVWLACGGGREAAPAVPEAGRPAEERAAWLVERPSGIDFVHHTGGTGEFLFPEIMGSGAALVDVDGDGDLDAYLVNGARDLGDEPAPGGPVNRLYRREADGRFADATAESGLGDPGYGMGVAAGDFDNDGAVDLYVTNVGRDRLFRNLGRGVFRDVTEAAGIDVGGWSTSATFWDYDRDGWLDLFVCRYVDYDPAIRCYDLAGRPDYCDPTSFDGASDVLLRNLGDGTFRDVSGPAGITALRRAGLGVVAADFDGDGWPDLYVANDREPNHLWIHQRDGRFRDEALILGVSVNAAGDPEAGMGVVAADFDLDGGIDLFVTHMAGESNTLYRNLGASGFEDRTVASGLARPSLPKTGFGAAAADLELDGDVDLLVVNGRVIHAEGSSGASASPWRPYAEPNQLFLNDGSGRFEEASWQAGAFAAEVEISRGLAAGDIDDDGDVDFLVSNAEAPARLYLNESPRRGHWLRIDAFDPRWNRRALGATVIVEVGGRRLVRTVHASSSYLSSSDPRAHFGLGAAEKVDALSVVWPDGEVERFPAAGVDRDLRLVRGEGRGQ